MVIDTIGYNDKSWLFSDREPHTEALHVIERMRLLEGGKLLEIVTTVEDPKALKAPYTYSRYAWRTNVDRPESVCNENTKYYRRLRQQALKAKQQSAAPAAK